MVGFIKTSARRRVFFKTLHRIVLKRLESDSENMDNVLKFIIVTEDIINCQNRENLIPGLLAF